MRGWIQYPVGRTLRSSDASYQMIHFSRKESYFVTFQGSSWITVKMLNILFKELTSSATVVENGFLVYQVMKHTIIACTVTPVLNVRDHFHQHISWRSMSLRIMMLCSAWSPQEKTCTDALWRAVPIDFQVIKRERTIWCLFTSIPRTSDLIVQVDSSGKRKLQVPHLLKNLWKHPQLPRKKSQVQPVQTQNKDFQGQFVLVEDQPRLSKEIFPRKVRERPKVVIKKMEQRAILLR